MKTVNKTRLYFSWFFLISAHFDKNEALFDLGLNYQKLDNQDSVSAKIKEIEAKSKNVEEEIG